MTKRRIAILAFPGHQPLDVAGPHEVFAGANAAMHARGRSAAYDVVLAGPSRAPLHAESGLTIVPGQSFAALTRGTQPLHTVVVAGGAGARRAAG